jgi:hypothetical protein
MGEKSGSGMNIPDHFSESLETVLVRKILKLFDPVIRNLFDPGSGKEKFGSGINIPDQHPGSASRISNTDYGDYNLLVFRYLYSETAFNMLCF